MSRWLLPAACAAVLLCTCKPDLSNVPRTEVTSGARGEAAARVDLAKGTPAIMRASGWAREWLAPDVDRETGLPFQDWDCMQDPAYDDAYNAAVRTWFLEHGLPPNSLKAHMLAPASLDDALRHGQEVAPGASVQAPDGRRIELRGDLLRVEGGPFTQPFQRSFDGEMVVAWGDHGAVLVELRGLARLQIDPTCACVLQVVR